jgi:hypothetical protein
MAGSVGGYTYTYKARGSWRGCGPVFRGGGCVGDSRAGASLSRCCGLAASRRVVALSRSAPLAWVAVGSLALVCRVVVSASGAAALALSALLGGVWMAICGT